ncbi:MAG TPA: LacI family DNA-binding transcriptional regulator [Armatimonadota bacterium]|nr:LacI family DNA-binding transcriptional regulator [Armatimonadota bacterium]
MTVRLRDIAEEVGVSVSTVSLVLNERGGPMVSKATRERVKAEAQRLGYQPNVAARALVTGRTHLVSVWLPRGGYGPGTQVMDALQKHLGQRGLSLLVHPTVGAHQYGEDIPPNAGRHSDGIIAVEGPHPLSASAKGPAPAGVTNSISLGAFADKRGDWVQVDLAQAARAAVEHLIAGGRQRVAYLRSADAPATGDPRDLAYSELLAARDLPTRYLRADGHASEAALSAIGACIAESGEDRPDALFCQNDILALGAFRAIRDAGLRVPDDVALVGCDGIPVGDYLDPPLSTIRQPVDEMCRLGCEFLADRIEHPGGPVRGATLTARFEPKGSSG